MPNLSNKVFAYGFSVRKMAIARRFLSGVDVQFIRLGREVPVGATCLLWGSTEAPATFPSDVRILRAEDGFLRSVGLGADLVRPLSWVIDRQGIYYDSTRPSDLEQLLLTHKFDSPLMQRATSLRERIVAARLTKYNVGERVWHRPLQANQVILVPGQVESDASLRFGAPGLRTNMELLQAVRLANPKAFVVYKPHPDVLAGLRAKGEREELARQWCDEVVTNVEMGELLDRVDEVHVLTSLAGFEALLRGKSVVCYGQPFYAGWGLTTDMVPVRRRTRQLSLDELVAGVLILYPTYVSYTTGEISTPEQALNELLTWRKSGSRRLPWWRLCLRPILGLYQSMSGRA